MSDKDTDEAIFGPLREPYKLGAFNYFGDGPNKPIKADDYWQEVTPWMMGYASCLPVEQGDDAVRQLHEVVQEITGRAVEQAEKPRMGFLP